MSLGRYGWTLFYQSECDFVDMKIKVFFKDDFTTFKEGPIMFLSSFECLIMDFTRAASLFKSSHELQHLFTHHLTLGPLFTRTPGTVALYERREKHDRPH